MALCFCCFNFGPLFHKLKKPSPALGYWPDGLLAHIILEYGTSLMNLGSTQKRKTHEFGLGFASFGSFFRYWLGYNRLLSSCEKKSSKKGNYEFWISKNKQNLNFNYETEGMNLVFNPWIHFRTHWGYAHHFMRTTQ